MNPVLSELVEPEVYRINNGQVLKRRTEEQGPWNSLCIRRIVIVDTKCGFVLHPHEQLGIYHVG